VIDFADLERRNAPLRAFVDFDPAATSGEGPLTGLTCGIKANVAVRGLPWTGGMGHRRGTIAERDASVVAKLRSAGAAILGTLNMHEAALGAVTDNAFYGRTHNPLRDGYTAGGSSGGSGAAVAAGLCDFAIGTDTLGSIRIPAAYCGVYGLKPTQGAVDTDGMLFLDARLDAIGPLSRDLDTLERVWEVIGTDRGEGEFARVLVLQNFAGVECEPAVVAGYDRALSVVDIPSTVLHLPAMTTDIRMAALAGAGRALIADLGEHRAAASDELRAILAIVEQVAEDTALLDQVRNALVDALGEDGVLLMPTTPHVAFAHDTRAPATQADFSGLANIAGLPALALPSGHDPSGLPTSIQLVGPAGSERRLIALARTLAAQVPSAPEETQ
jgi:aspartyl-tRNA(Asn)/glutamyl-tRNA(Gln) amidotransferase subunit A